ncbi:hypothetical protein E4T56_gene15185 [Termitomyces sp. T112]|nr:hypothetical protein E4T56_gene15185 [Termitomyces sp. T112]
MTPEERQVIQGFGQDLFRTWITVPTTVSLCYGILAPVAATVVYYSSQNKAQTWSSRWQSATTFLGLVMLTGLWVTIFQIGLVGYIFFQPSTVPLPKQLDIMHTATVKWTIIENWLTLIPPIINDAFIIWRAWVLFERRRWAFYVSIGLYLLTLIVTLVFLGIYSNPDILLAAVLSDSAAQTFLLVATTIMSFVTNFVATSFIGRTLWVHLRFLRMNMNAQHQQFFRLWHIINLLVDAGAVYSILQLLYIVPTITVNANQLAAQIFLDAVGMIYFSISTVYPALTIALIRGPFSIVGVHETVNSLQIPSLGV